MSAPEVHQLSLGPLTGVAFGPDRTREWTLSQHRFIFADMYLNRGRCQPEQQRGSDLLQKR